MSNFYEFLNASAALTKQERTSNIILSGKDHGTLIDITFNTFTQTITAAATLGNGWYCYIKNSGIGEITLDPNAAETIDGLTSFIMYPGEFRLVQCDGSTFKSFVIQGFTYTYTATATFTKPPGYSAFGGYVWAGGGSGGLSATANQGAGGGGGACCPFTFQSSAIASSLTVTVGAGGAAATVAGRGTPGGTSTFHTCNAYGGGAGGAAAGATFGSGGTGGGITGVGAQGFLSNGTEATANALGGTPTIPKVAGFLAISGGLSLINDIYGGGSIQIDATTPHAGSSVWGGGAGGFTGTAIASPGKSVWGGGGGSYRSTVPAGTSVHGGAGGLGSTGTSSSSGADGSNPSGGGGGKGSSGTGTSGAGGRGEVQIWGII